MDKGLGLGRRHPEPVRDLLVGPPLELPQNEGVAMVLGESGEDLGHPLAFLAALQDLERIFRMIPGILVEVVHAVVASGAARPGPGHVQRDVGGDPGNPRLEGVAAIEPGEALVHPEHGLLGGLVGVVRVVEDPLADVPSQPAVPPVDLGERLIVAGLEVEDQHPVVEVSIRAECSPRMAVAGLGGAVPELRNPYGHTSPDN